MTGRDEERVVRTLNDLLRFADEMHRYVVEAGEQNFYDHRPTQLVAEALLHRIGEAVSRLPDEFAEEHPEVSWRQMKAMRNVVAHEYGYIDHRIMWTALSRDLPGDAAAVARILGDG